MSNRIDALGDSLTEIESLLGSADHMPETVVDGLKWHLDKIIELLRNGSSGGIPQLKTVNGESLLGTGNIVIKTNQAFPTTWPTNGTTTNFCKIVSTDINAVTGMSYLGGVKWSDLPTGSNGSRLANAEARIDIINSTLNNTDKVLHLIVTSATTSPYKWERIVWMKGENVNRDTDWLSWALQSWFR